MTNVVINLLSATKLTSENYTTWKNTINTSLVIDDLKSNLIEEFPQIPAPNAAQNVREAYKRWMKANEKAREYLLANLSDVLAKKHENMMQEEASVREYVLNIMVHFNSAEMQGPVIDEASQVNFILDTLSKRFLQLCSNMVMND
ncbi:uncharacterized protein LOC120072099 [Benincasa hispida]|uniref:uncharacterized protein LOC120072099 n=1 Tax=Benincasa hispida TaxID=102211 RepID=UPI0018FFA9DA|nr:uncharacterized protein LOC120072099 [Benincasa hispida]